MPAQVVFLTVGTQFASVYSGTGPRNASAVTGDDSRGRASSVDPSGDPPVVLHLQPLPQ